MSGTGNDFIVIDNREKVIPDEKMVKFTQTVCRRGQSVGADGLILIENDPELDFMWKFFNSDGSVAEMCGNGARCASRFALMKGIAGREMVFRTLAGPIRAEVGEASVQVQLTSPFDLEETIDLEVKDQSNLDAGFINTGVPHTVIFVEPGSMENTPVEELGNRIRYHQDFSPAGTNVNFTEILGNNRIRIRTYERGVEGETLACGTGAVAAAIISTVRGLVNPPVEVLIQAGDNLIIHLDTDDPLSGEVYLEGPASLVYEGQLTEETIREVNDV